ncbi:lysylphosphatidylglycerol synthase transmembrane domain-containing protein [Vibrio sp. McD22-P3]|uniref:lysylphosphatidylglycerol synthase transmembrane domain-containing protein n=1 Tax=Vibrio sp. McD22-P3 TaxID=2724880 RepID=UPI001F23E9A8|nr:lysylphosphatidylglycerol synthase transmembrane domain-containing protein [Vibrio sp. McD22-P3]MCF4175269.1 flippase-like domain-containing protein [Vibrio sp. McD22-P3]
MNFFYFSLAVLLLIVGHSVRVRRWNNILPSESDSLRSVQFASLSLGYVINFFVPFKLGELVRACSYSFLGKRDLSVSLASVVFERLIDILLWSVLASPFLVLIVGNSINLESNNLLGIVVSLLGITFCVLIATKGRVKYISNYISSIFNDEISYNLRHFFWALGESYLRVRGNLLSFTVNTLMMWLLYACSYLFLSLSLDAPIAVLVSSLFNSPLSSTLEVIVNNVSVADAVVISIYFLCPVIFISGYVLIKNKFSYQPKRVISWFANPSMQMPNKKDYFASKEQFKLFLLRSFRNEVGIISEFDKFGMGDKVVLHRIFHGGSDALTTLIENSGNLYVRKFASSRGKEKLLAQKSWLTTHQGDLPLASVSDEKSSTDCYVYDMPYSTTSVDFYEYIHTVDTEQSWNVLQQVVENIGYFHDLKQNGHATSEEINKYIEEKLVDNFNNIKSLASEIFENQYVIVNSQKIDLDIIENWINSSEVVSEFEHKITTTIHGDLTIENVIIDPEAEKGWFIIDPNVGNLFESPLIDYAKLMQSLHLGYESLNRSIDCQYQGDSLSVSFYRSSQYAALSEKYDAWLETNYSRQFLKEVRLHEIIHYMRLIPYKFRKDEQVGIAFTACMLLLVDKFMKDFN